MLLRLGTIIRLDNIAPNTSLSCILGWMLWLAISLHHSFRFVLHSCVVSSAGGLKLLLFRAASHWKVLAGWKINILIELNHEAERHGFLLISVSPRLQFTHIIVIHYLTAENSDAPLYISFREKKFPDEWWHFAVCTHMPWPLISCVINWQSMLLSAVVYEGI